MLAQHYTAAGLHIQALPYWQRAGQRALERSAYREAVASLEQGLEVLQQLPDSRDTREQAIDLRLALRSALFPSRDLGRILACLREAEALAEALVDSRRLGQIARFLSASFYQTGVYDQATMAAQRSLALAIADGDVAPAGGELLPRYTPSSPGDYRRAIDCYSQTGVLRRRAAPSASDRCSCLPCVPCPPRLVPCRARRVR